MGQSIDLYSYDYEKLKNKIVEFVKTDNIELVEKILLSYGTKISDRYILLNQELWDEYSCYYNLSNTLDKVFNVEDSFDIYCSISNEELDRKKLISAVEEDEVLEQLGINYSDELEE